MRLLLSCIGRRGYIAHYFRPHLGPEGFLVGTSNSHWTPGFSACDRRILMPDIRSSRYLPCLLELCRSERIDALLSFFDPDVDALSRSRAAIEDAGVTPILPSASVSRISFDKSRTPRFLAEIGLRSAETWLDIRSAERAIARGELKFPVVVKPRFGFGSRDLFVARTPPELSAFYHYAPDMMIQRWLPGSEYHLDVLNDLDGRVLAVVPKRKTAMRAGETDQAVTVADPTLLALGERLGTELGRLGHVGPLDVDVFVHEGEPFVLELNPRFGGGYPLSHLAGADFPGLLVAMLRGERPEARIGDFQPDVVMMKDHAVLGGKRTEFEDGLLDLRSAAP